METGVCVRKAAKVKGVIHETAGRIPDADRALISKEKIVQYLLNFNHPDAASKARILAHAGFDAADPDFLEKALRQQHLSGEAREGKLSPFGKKYEITRRLSGPAGSVMVTSVWIVRTGESFPRLITIVPELVL